MSRVFDCVVVIILVPLGEKYAELMDRPAACVAKDFGFLDEFLDCSFRKSNNSTTPVKPAVAITLPSRCRLEDKTIDN